MAETLDRLLDALADTGARPRRIGPQWMAQCPAHPDRSPSLSIRDAGDRVLVHCFAGCELVDVLAAVGLGIRDLFDTPCSAEHRVRPRREHSGYPLGLEYTLERPDVPDAVKRDLYGASTSHVPVGSHPGGPVAPW